MLVAPCRVEPGTRMSNLYSRSSLCWVLISVVFLVMSLFPEGDLPRRNSPLDLRTLSMDSPNNLTYNPNGTRKLRRRLLSSPSSESSASLNGLWTEAKQKQFSHLIKGRGFGRNRSGDGGRRRRDGAGGGESLESFAKTLAVSRAFCKCMGRKSADIRCSVQAPTKNAHSLALSFYNFAHNHCAHGNVQLYNGF